MNRIKAWRPKLALAGAAGLLALAALEAGVRALKQAPPLPPHYGEYQAGDELPFRIKPGQVLRERLHGEAGEPEHEIRTNREGFRDVDRDLAKPPGVYRILGLGDSYTYGAGAPFEQTYLYRIEQRLNERSAGPARVDIIKAGQPRYWTEPERILLETVGLRYQPDLVLLGFTANDVTDTYIGLTWKSVRDGYLVTREAYELGPVGVWLYVRSHLARVLLKRYVARRLRHYDRGTAQTMKWPEVFVENGYHEADWRAVEAELEKIARICRAHGARLVLVHIPTNEFWRPNYAYAGDRLAAFGARRGVPVIDALPAIREAAAAGETLYWKKDIHCTPAGYRVIADAVVDGLRSLDLPPVRPNGLARQDG
jgi:lysophospholipase L1-like esterase